MHDHVHADHVSYSLISNVREGGMKPFLYKYDLSNYSEQLLLTMENAENIGRR